MLIYLAATPDDVAINDIPANQAKIDAVVTTIRSLGRRSVGIPEDVSSAAEVDTLVATVVSELGRLDTMVANAGIADVKPLLETTEDERKRMIDVNVHGVFNCYISAARQMVKQGGGGRILGA